MAEEKMFAEFPPVPTAEWERVIEADLKGSDYEKKLVWRTAEGFNVRPYYRAEDLAKVPFIATGVGGFPFVRGFDRGNAWRVHQTIRVTNETAANAEALAMLDSGCDSIGFCVEEGVDVSLLLKDIVLSAVEVVFCGSRKVAESVLEWLDGQKVVPADVHIAFEIDPLVKKMSLQGNKMCGECFGRIAELAQKFEKYPNVRLVTVHGDEFNSAGATITQELAYTLAVGHEYLVRLIDAGLSLEQAERAIRFPMAVSSNYFMEIAKFRAARMLWANVVAAYGGTGKIVTHAVTSAWNQTAYDPYVNMLRGTTEAMSATIGGVHSLEVRPFDASFENPTEFSQRIARNVQLLLKHESHFDQVADPSGGSYYIETLTNSIATEAWRLFREVENAGGYVAAFEAGAIVAAVDESAKAKEKAVATRRTILLGANQYPNFTETVKDVEIGAIATGNVLKPQRGAMTFEQIRLRVDASGKEPKAFMLTCGTLAMARARAQFACNFFACAGIRVIDNTFFATIEQGVESALASGAEIVVICASDDDYAALAPQIAKSIGNRAIVVVAGAPASRPELEAAGITHFISVRDNVLDTLKTYLKELAI